MRRCAGASSPIIRQRSIASRERGTGKVRAVRCRLLVEPPVPPGCPSRRAPIMATSTFDGRGIVGETSRRSTETKPSALLPKAKRLGRSRRNLCRISVYPTIAPRHHTTTGVSFGRLCTSPEISGVCDHKRQTSKVKRQKRLAAKKAGYASYACKTTRNPPPAHLTGNILLGAGDQKTGRTQI
jgi:hypothetical protein